MFKFKNLKIISIALFSFLLIYLLLGWYFIRLSIKENEQSSNILKITPPDLIAVFTGDTGRIPRALRIAKKYKNASVFITGVDERNTLQNIIEPLEMEEIIPKKKFEIDYMARNTIENVLSTLRFLRKNPNFKNILIISHDYHILRINLIMNKFKQPDDPYKFYYSGIPTKFSEFRNIKILSKEILKWLRTYLILMIWSPNNL